MWFYHNLWSFTGILHMNVFLFSTSPFPTWLIYSHMIFTGFIHFACDVLFSIYIFILIYFHVHFSYEVIHYYIQCDFFYIND